jgi:hypothetical protein
MYQYEVWLPEYEDGILHLCQVLDVHSADRDYILVRLIPGLKHADYAAVLRRKPRDREIVERLFGNNDMEKFVLTPRVASMRFVPRLNMEQGSVHFLLPENWLSWKEGPWISTVTGEIRAHVT